MSASKLTPLGAQARLRNDPRIGQFTTSDYRIFLHLILFADKQSCVITLTEFVWERITVGISRRTVTRSLAHLQDLGILIYEPGNGRANCGEVHLAIHNWGDPQKVTRVSTFAIKEECARVISTQREEVECTQPFSEQAHRRATTLSGKLVSEKVKRLVDSFHEKAKTPAHRLNKSFLSWEYNMAERLLDSYSRQTLRKAWESLWEYYGRTSRRKRPQQIGLLRFYCEHLDAIQKEKRTRKRIETLKTNKRREITEDWIARHERMRRDDLPEAIRVVFKNPCDSEARDTIGLEPLFSRQQAAIERRLADSKEQSGYYEELRADIARVLAELPDEKDRATIGAILDEVYGARCKSC